MWAVSLFNTCFDEGDAAILRDVLESGWVSMGTITVNFERAFAEYIGVRHAIAVTNGTAALHLANRAIGIGPGDEVLCPALTFVATANAIVYSGGHPVFADIQGVDDLTISPASIEKQINERTRAITVVHYAGHPCDMDAITSIARRYNLQVIEDSAHAPGARLGSLQCGAIGDIGCFSFFANKNMTTAEGGMITTNDDILARRIRHMRSHGMTSTTYDRHQGHAYSYDVTELGYNYRIDEIRSALGLRQLEKLPLWYAHRKRLRQRYLDRLSPIDALTIPFLAPRGESACHIVPILLNDEKCRPDFMAHMKANGIQTSIHYPPVHLFEFYRRTFGWREGALPNTEKVAAREVTLPLYPGMKDEEVDYVCQNIESFFNPLKSRQRPEAVLPIHP
ncbi:MAG: DegT/DnrJ/EryC1/StrS family aminotransferase [Desulfobacterales bacterium]|nr:DegT/DnrJ/EryC1/StrS family aminotransferase [Desulfobacterales bacterium]